MPPRLPSHSRPFSQDVVFFAGICLAFYLFSRNSAPSTPTTSESRAAKSSVSFPPTNRSDPPSTSTSSNPSGEPSSEAPPSAISQQGAFQTPPFVAARHKQDGKYHLLLCATGSVATIKIPAICQALAQYSNLSIRIILTESAKQFLQGQSEEQPHWSSLDQMKNVAGVYMDRYEWYRPWKRGDSILHIELRRWADVMVIAPLSANALTKLAQGMSDSLVLSVARAWDTDGVIDGVRGGLGLEGGSDAAGKGKGMPGRKTIMVAPAMNTAMWRHPATRRHLATLEGWSVENDGWIEVLPPIEKELACGDAGSGAMKEWKGIVQDIERKFPKLRKSSGAAAQSGAENG